MESSMILAQRAEYTAEKMHSVAVKTLNDTVSMKIITIVTLLYLPGTFLAVSYVPDKVQGMLTIHSKS
jgi:hypothetical protein